MMCINFFDGMIAKVSIFVNIFIWQKEKIDKIRSIDENQSNTVSIAKINEQFELNADRKLLLIIQQILACTIVHPTRELEMNSREKQKHLNSKMYGEG